MAARTARALPKLQDQYETTFRGLSPANIKEHYALAFPWGWKLPKDKTLTADVIKDINPMLHRYGADAQRLVDRRMKKMVDVLMKDPAVRGRVEAGVLDLNDLLANRTFIGRPGG
ncbi:MAG: hypothetical protein FWH25_03105 [Syntrophorhabdaceae bacterium]|nr:hypothetical protein [Syntrophorhabdaceae bacterium]